MDKGLESSEFVLNKLVLWQKNVMPKSMMVCEYAGTGDPFFGGNQDDRLLGISGNIIVPRSNEQPAVFLTIEAAHEAAKAITNRRENSLLGVLPQWR